MGGVRLYIDGLQFSYHLSYFIEILCVFIELICRFECVLRPFPKLSDSPFSHRVWKFCRTCCVPTSFPHKSALGSTPLLPASTSSPRSQCMWHTPTHDRRNLVVSRMRWALTDTGSRCVVLKGSPLLRLYSPFPQASSSLCSVGAVQGASSPYSDPRRPSLTRSHQNRPVESLRTRFDPFSVSVSAQPGKSKFRAMWWPSGPPRQGSSTYQPKTAASSPGMSLWDRGVLKLLPQRCVRSCSITS